MSEQDGNAGGFLRRWAQRKQAVQQAQAKTPGPAPQGVESPLPVAERDGAPQQHAPDQLAPDQLARDQQADESPARLDELTDADMPDLASLDEDSDYSGFLSSRVSESLRRQALRKLFHLPGFNITDGLNDYDEDYTRGNTLIEVAGKLAGREQTAREGRREGLPEAAAPGAQQSVGPAPQTDSEPPADREASVAANDLDPNDAADTLPPGPVRDS